MIAQLAPIIAPVLICAGIGYAWARIGRTFDTQLIGSLVIMLGAPCLVFTTVTRMDVKLDDFGIMSLAALCVIAVITVLAVPLLKIAGLSIRGYLPVLSMNNTGNMGLPLCLFAFGETGLAYGMAYFVVSTMLMFTFAISVSAGSFSVREVLKIPIPYAIAAALGFTFTGTPVPVWLNNTTTMIGGITIPLMLITLGISLARLRVSGLVRATVLSALRMMVAFAVAVLLAHMLELDKTARGVLILQSTMPAAVVTYVLAERYKTEPEEVAGIVVVSTALMIVVLPALLWFVL
ncbi:MAG: AEC family transporter [Rhodospirillales bacterium]